jgi:hypothetical protein
MKNNNRFNLSLHLVQCALLTAIWLVVASVGFAQTQPPPTSGAQNENKVQQKEPVQITKVELKQITTVAL